MSIANGLALPNPLSNGTTADAVQVMGDFNYLLSVANRALLDSGGGAGMNAQSTQIHNLANGTSANDAVNLSQLNGYALLSGATFTGGLAGTTLSLSSTLNATGAASFGGNVGVTGELQLYEANGNGIARFGASSHYLFWNGTTFIFSDPLLLVGALTANAGITATGALTTGNLVNSIGYLGMPQNAQTANYSLALTDAGGSVDFNGASLTCTIPANSSVAFPVGTVIMIGNQNASNLAINITTDTLTWSGTTTTGNRTLGQNGEARLRKVAATKWLIMGTALS